MRVLGLMSGTSADGVDAVTVDFSGCLHKPRWTLINSCSIKYSSNLRKKILEVSQGLKLNSSEWLELEMAITQVNAEAALTCDPFLEANLVGCHGQTVWHVPPSEKRIGASLQILRAPLLAQLLRKPVVFDFRAADLVLGGQGAPLVPLTDEALIGRSKGWRAILNLGGIANFTLIPPSIGPDFSAPVLGWDCGPANTLIDLAIQEISDDQLFFDKDGLIAKDGKPNELIISKWLDEPFFNLGPPKSTGREQYGLNDLKRRMIDMLSLSNSSKIATLTAFTAALVAKDLYNLYLRSNIRPIELLVSGGGSNNPIIMKELAQRCNGLIVSKLDSIGLPVTYREALSFALLAWWNVNKYPGNSIHITGVQKSGVLGIKVEPIL